MNEATTPEATTPTIFFACRYWFQASAGNTYHTVKVWVGDEYIGTSPITYGYRPMAEQTGLEILRQAGYPTVGIRRPVVDAVDVGLRRQLHAHLWE